MLQNGTYLRPTSTLQKFPIFAIFRLPSQKQEGGEIYILTEKTQCHEPFKRFLHTFCIFFSPTSVGMAICVILRCFSHKAKMSVCGPYRGCCRGAQIPFLFKPSWMPKECVRKDKFLRENQISDTYWSSPRDAIVANIANLRHFRVWLSQSLRRYQKCSGA